MVVSFSISHNLMFLCKLWKLPAVNLNTTSPRIAYTLFRVINMQSTFWSTSVLNFFKHWSYFSPVRPDSFDEKVSIFGCSFAFLWSFFFLRKVDTFPYFYFLKCKLKKSTLILLRKKIRPKLAWEGFELIFMIDLALFDQSSLVPAVIKFCHSAQEHYILIERRF